MLATARLIPVDARTVWNVLVDTDMWPLWGPSVYAVECRTRYIAAHSTGRVRTAVGVWLPFRVVRWEPGVYWDWRVAGVPATGHRVRPLDANRSEVTFSVPSWAPYYLPVCSLALVRIERLVTEAGTST